MRFFLPLVVLAGCSADGATTTPPPKRKAPETLTLEVHKVPKALSFVGTVVAPRDATLASSRGGRVDGYSHEVGQSVRVGEVLVNLGSAELAFASQAAAASATQAAARISGIKDAADLPSALAAKSAYDTAADALARAEKLHQQGSVSEQALTRAKSEAASAKAQYEGSLAGAKAEYGRLHELQAMAGAAQAALGDKAIKAPFDGIVLERLIEVGQMAGPGAPLLRVIDPSELRVRFDVPQFDADKVALGRNVIALADGRRLAAQVVRSTPGLVGEANARLVEAKLTQGAETGLLPGARLALWLEIGGEEDIVEVPLSATTSTAGLSRAWVVEDNRLVERLLSVARIENDKLLVRAGLKHGEQLVKTPEPDFRLGEEVQP